VPTNNRNPVIHQRSRRTINDDTYDEVTPYAPSTMAAATNNNEVQEKRNFD
jgi:hypothetical protein